MLHAAQGWTDEHAELPKEEVKSLLLDAFWKAVGTPSLDPVHAEVHRWRYAIPTATAASRLSV